MVRNVADCWTGVRISKLQISTDNLHRKRRKMTEMLFWAMHHFPKNSCKHHLIHRKSYMWQIDIHVEIVIKLPPLMIGLLQRFTSERKPTCMYIFYIYSLIYLFNEPCGNKLQVTINYTWNMAVCHFFKTNISDLVALARYQSTRWGA